MSFTCFANPPPWPSSRSQISSSSFTPLRVALYRVSPSKISRSAPPPAMLLGIPRLWGRRTPKQTETIETVEATPAPPISKFDKSLAWVKAHPFQLVLMGSLLYSLVKQIAKARAKVKPAPKSVGSPSATSPVSSSSSPPLRRRAIPKRHETREEALDLLVNTARKYIIVGGKGGVGKTSMSAAVATAFADRGQSTLIISTDPAHSLSDIFGQDISGGDAVAVVGIDNLYAQEVDPDAVKRTFKMADSSSMGMDELGLDDLNSLFESIPPGFDEAVALVEIVKFIQADAAYTGFERIVFDTAPTGHTLRLLALPDFLNGFFGKIISMKSKLGNMMNQFKGMFGQDANLDDSVKEMEELKRSMNMVRELFRDEVQTEFIVATIPNMMAIAESTRLVDELRRERIAVRHVFVNMVQPANDDCAFCAARHKEQSSNMKYLEGQFDGLRIATVQSFDKEIKGSAALRAMGTQLFPKQQLGNDVSVADTTTKSVDETSERAAVEIVE